MLRAANMDFFVFRGKGRQLTATIWVQTMMVPWPFKRQFDFMPRLCRNNVRDVFKPTVCVVTVFTASPLCCPFYFKQVVNNSQSGNLSQLVTMRPMSHQSTVKSYSRTSLGPRRVSPSQNTESCVRMGIRGEFSPTLHRSARMPGDSGRRTSE